MSRAGSRLLVAAVAAVATATAAPADGQVVRLVDEAGVVHYTNTPCHPRYVRLAPEACRGDSPPVGPTVVPALAAAPPAAPAAPAPPRSLDHAIATAATRHGVDPRLVEAMVHIESAGNPGAVSPKGARGLMQLMPARAASLGIADAFDVTSNLDGGVRHLKDLLGRYAGDLRLALAAYNAGEEAVRVHGGIPPYRETQDYVRKALARYGPGR